MSRRPADRLAAAITDALPQGAPFTVAALPYYRDILVVGHSSGVSAYVRIEAAGDQRRAVTPGDVLAAMNSIGQALRPDVTYTPTRVRLHHCAVTDWSHARAALTCPNPA